MENELEFCVIDEKDIKGEVEYWTNSVVVYVLGANLPYHVMAGFLNRIWKAVGIDKVIQVQKGVFLVRFQSREQQDAVLQIGMTNFDHKPVIISPWSPDLPLYRADVQSVVVWVQLPGLPLKYWMPEVLGRLTSQVGLPMMPDNLTRQRDKGQFARVLVHMDIKEQVKHKVYYKDKKGRLIHQPVTYEWMHAKCSICNGYGHETVA